MFWHSKVDPNAPAVLPLPETRPAVASLPENRRESPLTAETLDDAASGGAALSIKSPPQRISTEESLFDEALRESALRLAEDDLTGVTIPQEDPQSFAIMGNVYVNDDRPKWDSRFDYLMTVLGFAVDLSTVWRLPYLCYKHKGICFLIPYLIMMAICGVPLTYLEFIVGQFLQESPVGTWKVCPLFKGTGYAMMFVTFLTSCTYNIYNAWMVLYIVGSLSPPPDWPNNRSGSYLAGQEYFENYILKATDPISGKKYTMLNLGPPDPLQVAYFSCIYLMFVVFMIRGMQNSVKVMTLSTGFPAIILAMLAFRGATLRGSSIGFKFLSQAKCFKSFLEFETWLDAASQVVYSLGLGYGVHVSISSLISGRTKAFQNALIVVATTTVTSVISILVIFAFLGGVAFIMYEDVDKLKFNKQNVMFDVIPDALGLIPSSNFFALIFYMMLFCLTFCCQLAGMHSVVLNLRDAFSSYGHATRLRTCMILCTTLVLFYAIGVLSLAKGGHHVLYAVEDFIATMALLTCAAVQAIGICWFYGVDNICRAEYAMNDFIPPLFIRICWKFAAPIILFILVLGELIRHRPALKFKDVKDIRHFGGYILGCFPLIIIVIVGIVQLIRVRGPNKLLCLISPEIEHQRIRETGTGARATKRHWMFAGTNKQMEEVFPHLRGVKSAYVEGPPQPEAYEVVPEEEKEPEPRRNESNKMELTI